jgi:hypothetical protein
MRASSLARFLVIASVAFVPALAVADEPAEPTLAEQVDALDPTMGAIAHYAETLAANPIELAKAARPRVSVSLPDFTRYHLVPFRSDGIDQQMAIANGSNGVPAALNGLWWMDGNPLPDKVVSFANAKWNEDERLATIEVYSDRVWSWHGDAKGLALYTFVRKFELVYELSFDETRKFAVIVPVIRIGAVRVRVPESIVKFTAREIQDGLWLRESYWKGELVHTYSFRRIVDGNGNREATFDDYVKASPEYSFLAEKR